MALKSLWETITRRLGGDPGLDAPGSTASETTSLPPGRYVFAVESIPLNYAGRTSSILNKIRTFSSLPGVSCELLVTDFTSGLPAVAAGIAQRAALPAETRIRSLYSVLDPAGEPVEAGTSTTVLGADGLLQSDEVSATGTLRRRRQSRPGESRPLSESFWRADGSLAFHRTRTPDGDDPAKIVDSVVPYAIDGTALPAVPWTRFAHSLLDRVVAESTSPVFLTVEARVVDRLTLGWRNPLVAQAYVLHNPHLLPPYDDVDKIRGGFKAVFRRREQVATVFLTEQQRADAVAHYGPCDHWWVIPHAVRSIAPGDAVRDPNLIVMVGRLHPQKRMSLAIDAMALVQRTRPGARLEIYGEGEQHAALLQQIDRLSLSDGVTLAGYTQDVDAVYRRASVSLLTSEYEGLGLVLVESLLNGCPAVACNVRYGPSDIITDGGNGLLCESSPGAVAAAIDRLLGDPGFRQRMSAAGPQVAERYSEHKFLQSWAELFRTIEGLRTGDA